MEHGVQGWGVTTIEHFEPVSYDETGTNDYGNCYYSCRLCNGSRGNARPVDTKGRRLLDPCTEAWGDHFSLSQDRLVPRTADARYTAWVYGLDDQRKIAPRQSRRERMLEWLELCREGPDLVDGLLAKSKNADTAAGGLLLLKAAEKLRRSILRAIKDIKRYTAIPPDADVSCRCQGNKHLELPGFLASQTINDAEFLNGVHSWQPRAAASDVTSPSPSHPRSSSRG